MKIHGKFFKRVRQFGFLCRHPLQHWYCQKVVRESSKGRLVANGPRADLKYLGDYLWLSMPTDARRKALIGHYQRLEALARDKAPYLSAPSDTVVWQLDRPEQNDSCQVFLEPARLAPMEGELQLRFAFQGRDLFTVTFLIAPGHLFGASAHTVLFIGGIQGGVNCRQEIREASKSNGEISPAKMLMIAIEAIARDLDIAMVLAVSDDEQISRGYASDKMQLDYHDFWTEAGGLRHGKFYRLFAGKADRPLSEIPISHRARTRRKREKKLQIRETIEAQLRSMAPARMPTPANAEAPFEQAA